MIGTRREPDTRGDGTCNRGPGLWRFNNSLLKDTTFVNAARCEIEKKRINQDVYANVAGLGLKL